MEKKTRSSRKAPAAFDGVGDRDQRMETRGRRARTLADATDPRTPVRRRDDYEPEYSARDEQAPSGSPLFTLPSVPAMPAVSREDTEEPFGK